MASAISFPQTPRFGTQMTVVFLVELIYALFSRIFLWGFVDDPAEHELWRNVLRLLTLALYWPLYREFILTRQPVVQVRDRWLLLLGAGLMLVAMTMVAGHQLAFGRVQIVYSVTSPVVGLREEIVYRGILLNALLLRMPAMRALLLSNLIFTLYHYGAQPLYPANAFGIFAYGCVFAWLYLATGSLLWPILLHTLVDVIAALTDAWWIGGTVTLLDALGLACMGLWHWRRPMALTGQKRAEKPGQWVLFRGF